MSSEKFLFTNGRLFENNQPSHMKSTVLRDENGDKYAAYYPDRYDILGYFNMGGKWRVTRIVDKKTHKPYLLKNLKQEHDFKECYAITKMVGCVLRNFNQQVVTIPRIIESGRTEYGISYIIEQEAYGVRPTSDVIRKMSESEFDKFSRKIAAFLHELHTIQNGEVLSKISDQTVFRDPLIFDDPRYQNKSCYSKENFAYKTIVHSDLVPRNILIDLKNNDHVSILDWGEVHYDYPFSEFYRMYTNNSTFDEHVIDSISREYMNLRDADRNKEKCTCCCTATCQTKQHAKPTMPYRLPLYMKKTYGYQM